MSVIHRFSALYCLAVTIAADLVTVQSKTALPPCCRDMLTQVTCQRLQRVNATEFGHRCNYDAEFRLIQCCTTCNRFKGAVEYDRIAESLVAEKCFDRYSANFCRGYVGSTGIWEMKQWSCEGSSPYIAFRTCRRSCGFCDFASVKYTLANALEACKMAESNYRHLRAQIGYDELLL